MAHIKYDDSISGFMEFLMANCRMTSTGFIINTGSPYKKDRYFIVDNDTLYKIFKTEALPTQ